jgi:membrane protein implicated in regulation of membrane protease activity
MIFINSLTQTIVALAIVAVAATWLVVRAVRKRSKPGCGGDCGCAAEDLRAKALRELKTSGRQP